LEKAKFNRWGKLGGGILDIEGGCTTKKKGRAVKSPGREGVNVRSKGPGNINVGRNGRKFNNLLGIIGRSTLRRI